MTDNITLKRDIEAILFTMGEAVEVSILATALSIPAILCDSIIDDMIEEYMDRKRGISIIRLEDSVQLCTKKECYDSIIKVTSKPKKSSITDIMLEVLSIVAYRQPITKIGIEEIRGVKSDYLVNKLLEYGLIEEIGRADGVGRPILFGTSEEFLRRFSLSSLSDLPDVDELDMEALRKEAEEELQIRFDI